MRGYDGDGQSVCVLMRLVHVQRQTLSHGTAERRRRVLVLEVQVDLQVRFLKV